MHKPTARIAVAALAIPLFGGFATYAAAQVSTKPAPQVVIPAAFANKAKAGVKTSSTTAVRHDANDDKANHDKANHDTSVTKVSDDPVGHDATDDHGHDVTVATAPGTTTPTSIDDHGHDVTVTTAPGTTPTSIDDHGGSSSRRHGSDG
jgi:hypothetical protein